MSRARVRWLVGIALLAGSGAAASADAPSADEIMRRAHLAMYYAGADMRTRVTMRLVSTGGAERVRELTMARRTLKEGGEQRYFLFFHRPPDVRDMAFLVWKYPGRDDDRWLYVPALKLVRRIAASDKHTSFVGSDFSYEDVSGREPEDDTHRLLREGRRRTEAYVVESTPKEPGAPSSAGRCRGSTRPPGCRSRKSTTTGGATSSASSPPTSCRPSRVVDRDPADHAKRPERAPHRVAYADTRYDQRLALSCSPSAR
jgi:hypothetical protein